MSIPTFPTVTEPKAPYCNGHIRFWESYIKFGFGCISCVKLDSNNKWYLKVPYRRNYVNAHYKRTAVMEAAKGIERMFPVEISFALFNKDYILIRSL